MNCSTIVETVLGSKAGKTWQVGTSERLFEADKFENDVAIDATHNFAGRGLNRCEIDLPDSQSLPIGGFLLLIELIALLAPSTKVKNWDRPDLNGTSPKPNCHARLESRIDKTKAFYTIGACRQ